MTRIANNPTHQLASLIRPEWEGYPAARSFGLDSFVRIESPWVRLPRPPLYTGRSHYDFFKKTLESYEGFIQSIEDPRAFAGAWSDLSSIMLGNMATIAGGLYTVLTNMDQSAPGEPTLGESEIAAIEALYPDIDSLVRLYGATDSFYKNESLLNGWEGMLLRGQKHFMGNIVLFVRHIDFLLKHGALNFEGLSALLTDLDGLFNPFQHTTRAYDADKIGGWLTYSIDDGEAPPVGYWTNPKLRRVTDEIFYQAGASARNGPNEIEMGWHGERGAVVFRNGGHALSAFARGMPAREFVTGYYGEENIEFIEGAGESDEASIIEEIRVSAYTTSLAVAAAAMATVSV
jgi:hypothetical protein